MAVDNYLSLIKLSIINGSFFKETAYDLPRNLWFWEDVLVIGPVWILPIHCDQILIRGQVTLKHIWGLPPSAQLTQDANAGTALIHDFYCAQNTLCICNMSDNEYVAMARCYWSHTQTVAIVTQTPTNNHYADLDTSPSPVLPHLLTHTALPLALCVHCVLPYDRPWTLRPLLPENEPNHIRLGYESDPCYALVLSAADLEALVDLHVIGGGQNMFMLPGWLIRYWLNQNPAYFRCGWTDWYIVPGLPRLSEVTRARFHCCEVLWTSSRPISFFGLYYLEVIQVFPDNVLYPVYDYCHTSYSLTPTQTSVEIHTHGVLHAQWFITVTSVTHLSDIWDSLVLVMENYRTPRHLLLPAKGAVATYAMHPFPWYASHTQKDLVGPTMWAYACHYNLPVSLQIEWKPRLSPTQVYTLECVQCRHSMYIRRGGLNGLRMD